MFRTLYCFKPGAIHSDSSALFIISFVFFNQIFIVMVLVDLLRYSNSLLAVSAMLSANRMLTISLPPVLIPFMSVKASVIKISRNMLKSIDDIRDPYLKPRGPEPLAYIYVLIEMDCTNGFLIQLLIQ